MNAEHESLFEGRFRVLVCPVCGVPIPLGTSPFGHVCSTSGKPRPK